jgi:hypothetical protein
VSKPMSLATLLGADNSSNFPRVRQICQLSSQ